MLFIDSHLDTACFVVGDYLIYFFFFHNCFLFTVPLYPYYAVFSLFSFLSCLSSSECVVLKRRKCSKK